MYPLEIDEAGKRLQLWVRCLRANKQLVSSGCGKPDGEIVASYEREVRDFRGHLLSLSSNLTHLGKRS